MFWLFTLYSRAHSSAHFNTVATICIYRIFQQSEKKINCWRSVGMLQKPLEFLYNSMRSQQNQHQEIRMVTE